MAGDKARSEHAERVRFARLAAGGDRIRTSGTAEDAGLVADLYAHKASRRIPQKGVRIRQSLACAALRRECWAWRRPVRPFPTPEDGEQECRLAPIGRHLVRPLRGGVLRTRCFPRQAAFQGGHEIDDGRRLAAFRRGRPAAAGCYRGHAGFPDPLSLSCGLLWPYGVARRGACEDRAAARDHARGGEPFSKAAFQAMACYGSSTWIRQD